MNNKSATLRTLLVAMLFATCATLQAQIGSHRNDLSVGVNGGYVMNSVGFDPKVPQNKRVESREDYPCVTSARNTSVPFAPSLPK